MAVVYPIVVILIVDDVRFYEYVTKPGHAFPALVDRLASLAIIDVVILSCGFMGAILAGIAIRMLRVRGYQMF